MSFAGPFQFNYQIPKNITEAVSCCLSLINSSLKFCEFGKDEIHVQIKLYFYYMSTIPKLSKTSMHYIITQA